MEGCIKLNVDGCSKGNFGLSTVGGIIRHHYRVVLLAFTNFVGHQSILFAELIALLMELELACQMGFLTFFVESDSATVVFWVSSLDSRCWDFGYLWSKIRHLCTNYHMHIHHVYREAN